MPHTPISIAIDGPASSGKGTVARLVAATLGYQHVDSGALYRALAWVALEAGVPWTDGPTLAALVPDMNLSWRPVPGTVSMRLFLADRDVEDQIRTEAIGRGASDVSKLPPVRAALLQLQRDWGLQGGVVMDGRDIGTVVWPDAGLKIFLTATVEARALRRFKEQRWRGVSCELETVQTEIEARDHQDSNREVAPLKQAADAHLLDTTDLAPGAAADQVVAWAQEASGAA
jgi:CMP/dCMP kinase